MRLLWPKNSLMALLAIGVVLLAGATQPARAGGTCNGRFINPITDICWECIFPISIGGASVNAGGGLPDTPNPSSPICACPAPPPVFVKLGLAIGYWEPAALTEAVRQPYCFPTLDGLSLGNVTDAPRGTGKYYSSQSNPQADQGSFYQMHWYSYPLLYVFKILSTTCGYDTSIDIQYITEVDPTWNDDELTFLLNPEAVLFSNPVAQAACAGDCAAASVGLPLDSLFWCAGCDGSMYPLDGHVSDQYGGVQGSALLTERFTYKLHREGLLPQTAGSAAMCVQPTTLMMQKSQYRRQLVYPIPQTGGLCCSPYGKTTTLTQMGKEFPYKGEDFGYVIWRKRNCCDF